MEKYILYLYMFLIVFMLGVKSYWNYRKAFKNGEILLSKRAMPVSKWDILLFIIIIYILGDIIGNRLNRGYGFVVMYALVIIFMIILNSKLLITDGGIYFMSHYTSWNKVNEVILVNETTINVRRQIFLSDGYKIRNFSYDDEFISIVKEKCIVSKL